MPGSVVGLPRSMPGAVVLTRPPFCTARPFPSRCAANRTEPNPPAPISRATSPCKEMPRVSFIWKTESVTEIFSGAFAFQNLKTSGFSVPCIKRYNNVRKNRKLNTPPASLSGLEIRGVRRKEELRMDTILLKNTQGFPGGGQRRWGRWDRKLCVVPFIPTGAAVRCSTGHCLQSNACGTFSAQPHAWPVGHHQRRKALCIPTRETQRLSVGLFPPLKKLAVEELAAPACSQPAPTDCIIIIIIIMKKGAQQHSTEQLPAPPCSTGHCLLPHFKTSSPQQSI